MPFKIVRNDITKMNTEAIVNTANDNPTVGTGCDGAVYKAAGFDELLKYRVDQIGFVPEGDVFITPGFQLQAKFIIHAVSPLYIDGTHGEEEKLRSCYKKSLLLAKENQIKSIAFPLISSGGFGYPKEEAMRIAVDEINAFLLENEMDIYLVVFDTKSTALGEKLYPSLDAYIDQNYVEEKNDEEYAQALERAELLERRIRKIAEMEQAGSAKEALNSKNSDEEALIDNDLDEELDDDNYSDEDLAFIFEEKYENKLQERIAHVDDTFSQYLMYLIKNKNMKNVDVWRRAIVDKKVFSKMKNNIDYKPKKITALCLCVGAMLNLDETKDLLARAGYALSPSDKTDIIFSFFIENKIYDMIQLDIQLEEHGLPCIIS